MNKDQKLLEEAYKSLYNVDLLPEEELYVEKVCEDIYDNAEHNVGRRMIPQRQGLASILFHNPSFDHLTLLNYPESLQKQVRYFYLDVYASLARNVFIQSQKEPSGKVTREKYFHIYLPTRPLRAELKVVEFKDKEKVIETLKTRYTKLLQGELRSVKRDGDRSIYQDLMKWRDKKIADIKVTGKLSKDFDVNVLNDFE